MAFPIPCGKRPTDRTRARTPPACRHCRVRLAPQRKKHHKKLPRAASSSPRFTPLLTPGGRVVRCGTPRATYRSQLARSSSDLSSRLSTSTPGRESSLALKKARNFCSVPFFWIFRFVCFAPRPFPAAIFLCTGSFRLVAVGWSFSRNSLVWFGSCARAPSSLLPVDSVGHSVEHFPCGAWRAGPSGLHGPLRERATVAGLPGALLDAAVAAGAGFLRMEKCSSCYALKSRRFVAVADAGFEDAADGTSDFGGTMSLAHKQKVVEETVEMEEEQEFSWKSNLLRYRDDEDFVLSGSSKHHASTSGKIDPRIDRSGSNETSKVPRLGSILGTASMAGFGKAVEIIDTLGCLMTTLSSDGGFVSRTKTKGCKISILAFEVANTILKGASIMQSLSEDTVTYFKQVVLPSEGVQNLVSSEMSELMRITANDKREELRIFSQEIVRFGNRCKDPQWHNLDRYFVKLESEIAPQKQLKETAISEMQKLMNLVQRTTDLYHELHALDRFEQEYRSRINGKGHTGDNIQIVRLELKTQSSYVKSLKKRSLWSKTLEEVVEKLVDIVHYLHVEINSAFGSSDGGVMNAESTVSCQRLGPAGLALHYANIIIQIYSIVSRSGYVPANSRDALYQGLPPRIKSALPNKLRTTSVPRELTLDQIRARMEKTLKWLVPMAINTTCARGFLRFSEWAKSGTERVGRRPGQADLIETLYHADKARTEDCILELVVWLHHLVSQSNRPGLQKAADQCI